MKSVTVAPRSGLLIKDGNDYFLILILFNRLLSADASHHGLDKTNSPEQHKVHEIKCFTHQGPCKLIPIARTGTYVTLQNNCFAILLAKNRFVTTGKYFQIQLPKAVARRCSVSIGVVRCQHRIDISNAKSVETTLKRLLNLAIYRKDCFCL